MSLGYFLVKEIHYRGKSLIIGKFWSKIVLLDMCSTGNKTGLQPVSRPLKQVHYLGVEWGLKVPLMP